jgi:hypothetical protein
MAKYTLDELHQMILPMVQSLGNRPPEELTGAIIDLIKQDREANAAYQNTKMAADDD